MAPAPARSARAVRSGRGLVTGTLGAATALMLAGCSWFSTADASPAASGSSAAAVVPTPPGPSAPALRPSGSPVGGDPAAALARFDASNRATIAAHPKADAAQLVQGLIAAGFAASTMQASADTTSAGLVPGSVSVSVKTGGRCLIGQFGAAVGGYHSAIVAPLATGACLIGSTQPVG